MNHPSDYLIQDRESSSSDQSQHNISLQIKPTPLAKSHKKNTSTSFVQMRQHPKKQKKNRKKVVFKPEGPPPKPNNRRSKYGHSDYLIVGGSFFSCKSAKEVSHRLMKKQPEMIMKGHRLKRKQSQCLLKIEKYMHTFLHNIKRRPFITQKEKIELYHILKEDREEKIQDKQLQTLMRELLQILDKNSESLVKTYPLQKDTINKWKNHKMHQLMAFQQFSYSQMKDTQLNFQKELYFFAEEQFFPELREQIKQLEKDIRTHLSCAWSQGQGKGEGEDRDQGVKWVLDRLICYLQENEEHREEVLRKMAEYQSGFRDEPLLDDSLFVCFERDQIGEAQSEEQTLEKSLLHIFNKAVFDLVNQTALVSDVLDVSLEGVRGVIEMAWVQLSGESWQFWREDLLLWVDELIYQQLLDDFLQDFVDFY